MRLTKTDKGAFVRAVMNDVPSIDHSEQAQAIVIEHILSNMPIKVRTVWDDLKTRHYIAQDEYYYLSRELGSFRGPQNPIKSLPPGIQEAIKKLHMKAEAQIDARYELKTKVNSLIASCSTLKKAHEILPEELHKYLPADRDNYKTANVPVVRDVVKTLKAAGWPTNKEKK